MSDKIPDTDKIEVAMIAAALELAGKQPPGRTAPALDESLERFQKAYEAIKKAVIGS